MDTKHTIARPLLLILSTLAILFTFTGSAGDTNKSKPTDEERKQFEAVKARAEKGDAESQFRLGIMYDGGTAAVAADQKECLKWIRKSAEQNYANAQHILAVFYADGDKVEKDYVEAYAWWNLASVSNKQFTELRDKIEKKMTPQQIADAQKRTKELKTLIEAKKK